MQMTITTDVQNKSASGVKKHVEHDENVNHSNKDIDFSRTKNNQHFDYKNGQSEKQILQNDFGEQLRKMNKLNEKKHPDRVKNFSEYINSMKGVPFKTMLVTIGNKDNWPEGFDTPENVSILNKSFDFFVRRFNYKFGEHLTITEQTTNLDESTPHSHMTLYTHGKTGKRQKHSTSLNANLKEEYSKHNDGKTPPSDTRKLMSWWRKQTDELMEQCLRESGFDVELMRTGIHVASFDEYKEIKEQSEKIKAQDLKTKKEIEEDIEFMLIDKQEECDLADLDIYNTKNDLISDIADIEPERRYRLGTEDDDEEENYDESIENDLSDPISTENGRKQFRRLKMRRLGNIFKSALQKSVKTLKTVKNGLESEVDKLREKSSRNKNKIKLSTATDMLKTYYNLSNGSGISNDIKKKKFENLFLRKEYNGLGKFDRIHNDNNVLKLDELNGKRVKHGDFYINQTASEFISDSISNFNKYEQQQIDNAQNSRNKNDGLQY